MRRRRFVGVEGPNSSIARVIARYETVSRGLQSRLTQLRNYPEALYGRYRRQTALYVRAEVKLFLGLETIPPTTKQELRHLVHAHATQVARADVWYRSLLKMDAHGGNGLGAFAPPSLLPSLERLLAFLIIGVPLLVGAMWGSGIVTALLFVLTMTATIGPVVFLRFRHPETVIVEHLLVVLAEAERGSTQWIRPKFRRAMMVRLEEVASCVEKNLLRALKVKDSETKHWIKREMKSRSIAVRALKRLIVSPKLGTSDELRERLGQTLVHAIRGDWTSLEPASSEEVREARWRRFHAKPLLQSILMVLLVLLLWQVGGVEGSILLIAALPAILVWLTENTLGLKVPDVAKLGATIIWPLAFIIPSLDPHWKDRLEDIIRLRELIQ